ncbi:MAG TPA: hypothetical protein VJX31_13300 [Casimicrobiaceae bacterium]|nr:hypothetical protein [Casimicrobiaceae bacterium]
MNKLRIASTVIALASAITFPAWAANTTDVSKDGASNLDSAVTQPANANATAPADSKATQSKARKHPPTAAMDSATPAEKTTTDKSAATKHPPTSQMDRAAPDQKSSPTSSDTSSTGPGTSAAAPRN